MPWFNVQAMSTADLRAMYRYIKSLGPAGKPAPAYLPPDKKPPQPYVAFPKSAKILPSVARKGTTSAPARTWIFASSRCSAGRL